jgi:hypothetical protein
MIAVYVAILLTQSYKSRVYNLIYGAIKSGSQNVLF